LGIDALLTAPVALPVLGNVMRYTVTAVSARLMLQRTVKAMFMPKEVRGDFLPTLSREMMLRPVQLRANAEDAAFMIGQAKANSERHRELQLPVTIFAGAEDAVIDVEAHSVRLHSELSQSKLVVVPGAGHMIHYEALDEIVAAIDYDLPLHESLTESALKPLGLEEVPMPF
jgi:pimeloyl-ACP methyl ester carboxylesterase